MAQPRQARSNRHSCPRALPAVVAACALAAALGGCAGTETPQAPTEPAAPAPADAQPQPVAVTHVQAHETREESRTDDAALAQRLYDAYRQGTLGEPVETCAADYDDTVVFTMADGSETTLRFNAHNLFDGDAYRRFEDAGGFWDLLAAL